MTTQESNERRPFITNERGPRSKKIVHICARCGVQMQYKGKYIVSGCEVKVAPGRYFRDTLRPVRDMSYNLCTGCYNLIKHYLQLEMRYFS